ncbi:CHAD domain-containing protein [Ferrimonas sediminum]|uniref:CHAD domain-containing protein n=1 Tax=Ferrimonas sediminum TaxID=718193 RepID=A0A1G8QYX0_9GAMM|nr:CHAD domain-containing protein [Ferrimonas sediminum]SDJ09861.1 CHAD domain-containing protein [Ferrimonas sediminum]
MAEDVVRVLQPKLASLYQGALHQGESIDLKGDGEPLHHYRVGLRKCRSLLKLYRQMLPQALYESLVISLGQQARVTNLMRDLDVLQQSLPASHPLLAVVEAWRRQAFTELFLQLGQLKRERALCVSVMALPWPKALAQFSEVTENVAVKLEGKIHRVHQRALLGGHPQDWHRLRIVIKRRRYLKEQCQPGASYRGDKALQDALGAFNDSCCQIAFLEQQQQRLSADLQPVLRQLLEQLEHRRQQQLAALGHLPEQN